MSANLEQMIRSMAMFGGGAIPVDACASVTGALQLLARFRQWFCDELAQVFESIDVVLAPTSPCAATPIGAKSMNVRGQELGPRAYMGMLTQPISVAGLPVITVPFLRERQMPLGVQIIAPPWREDVCFRVARLLEQSGAASSRIAMGALPEISAPEL